MIDKLKEIFNQKDKKIENLVFLLVILIITLISINYIIKDTEKPKEKEKYLDAELANSNIDKTNLEARIEQILNKIDGVRKCIGPYY